MGGINYVKVPVSSSDSRFRKNAKKLQWIQQILKTAGSNEFSEDDVAVCIMMFLVDRHPEALVALGQKLKIPELLADKRMDPFTAASMWNEANVPLRGQRAIKRYVYTYFGFWLTPAEHHISAITDHHVEPIHGESIIEEKMLSWWYKNIDDVVKTLLDNEWYGLDFNDIDVVFGGDHGQGVFGAAVKIILWKGDNIVRKAVEKIGHIDSDKDNYTILNETIAPFLNTSLQYIKDKVLFLGVGDLKFVSMSLGKVNMDSHWCHLCDLSPNEWMNLDHSEGNNWTLAGIEALVMALDTKIIKDTPANRKGCVREPLFGALEPWDWIIPCLHVMMGAMNDAFAGLVLYVEQRHECISLEENEARRFYWKELIKLDDAIHIYNACKGVYEHYDAEIKKLRRTKEQRVRRGNRNRSKASPFLHSKEARDAYAAQIKLMSSEATSKRNSLNEKAQAVKILRASVKLAKNEVGKVQKKDGREVSNSQLRQKMDKCLKDHGVDRGASHGGDFTGVACLILEERVDDIIEEIETILLDYGNGKQEEIKQVCKSYRLHFLLSSHMFSLARTSRTDMRDPITRATILSQLKEVIPLVFKSTERMPLSMRTPKRHIMEHLITMMEMHDGIAEYLEDWVEHIHQRYINSKSRGKMRDLVKIANYHSRVDKLYHNPKILKIKEEVRIKRERVFKKESSYFKGNGRKNLQQEARRGRRLQAVVEARVLFAETPQLESGLGLNLVDERAGIDNMTEARVRV
ncbi:hypothetical protein FRACYDRAFT_235090 [Fragilariopsis cylindrus CCMP1102]|uniref:Uncharacterized protein n=1 Tax=Fragilariopsis cylindrus CCMP1102 TaxID=635003 RepID=A0A1E7FTL7_9STRA|nr:hypothetical protein FRACYDRAFT_235090 [Fragilariopsis cylindrus CCMP1102]|eukprot:OEU21464.1 hypothetical protein FRACYDRAFT_235090 [Fragilariopsis cylindrus CCMP1102]